jgi:glycosyltransferase involved in cell wall biosynthesis
MNGHRGMKERSPVGRRCLLLSTADNTGGMERVVCSLARGLGARGWRTHAAFPHSANSARLLAWCREQRVIAETHPAIPDAAAAHDLGSVLALRRYVRQARPHVVNLHYGSNFISLKDILAVRLAGRHRCYVTVHQAAPWETLGAQKRRMTRLAAHLTHGVIAICDATARVLREAGVPERKIHTVFCGVRGPDAEPTRDSARQLLNIPPDAFVVASLANLVPRKGLPVLLEAAAMLPDPERKLRVVIGGDGPERGRLEALAAESLNGRARFLGHLERETGALFAAADAFVLPSYQEGLPLVYIEAALQRTPSIGTDVGGTNEVVLDGETGLLIPPGDAPALAAAIDRLRLDARLRCALAENARRRARSHFSERAMTDGYERLFRG